MTRDQLQRLVDGAMVVIDKCDEDECTRFATWQAWEWGNLAGGQPWCDDHVPPCTEMRGGYCKQGADGYQLAQELNALMDEDRLSKSEEVK